MFLNLSQPSVSKFSITMTLEDYAKNLQCVGSPQQVILLHVSSMRNETVYFDHVKIICSAQAATETMNNLLVKTKFYNM